MTGESLGDRARPHTHTHKEPTVPSKFNTHLRDGFSTALVASAREAGTDHALQQLLTRGGIDVASARRWLEEALACLSEPLDGCSVGNAANQAAKAVVALGHKDVWERPS